VLGLWIGKEVGVLEVLGVCRPELYPLYLVRKSVECYVDTGSIVFIYCGGYTSDRGLFVNILKMFWSFIYSTLNK